YLRESIDCGPEAAVPRRHAGIHVRDAVHLPSDEVRAGQSRPATRLLRVLAGPEEELQGLTRDKASRVAARVAYRSDRLRGPVSARGARYELGGRELRSLSPRRVRVDAWALRASCVSTRRVRAGAAGKRAAALAFERAGWAEARGGCCCPERVRSALLEARRNRLR